MRNLQVLWLKSFRGGRAASGLFGFCFVVFIVFSFPSLSWGLEFNTSVLNFPNSVWKSFPWWCFACFCYRDGVSKRNNLTEVSAFPECKKRPMRECSNEYKTTEKVKVYFRKIYILLLSGREEKVFSLKASCQNAVSSDWSGFKFRFPYLPAAVQGAWVSSYCSAFLSSAFVLSCNKWGSRTPKGTKAGVRSVAYRLYLCIFLPRSEMRSGGRAFDRWY